VTIGVGGHGRLDVAVVDADSGSPVAGATVVLRGRQASVFGGARTTDAAGRVSLARVPPGAFELEVWAAGWLAAHERIDIADDAVAVAVAAPARVVRLERASWLVLSIANLRSPLAERAVLAWVVGGDDPGWPHRDRTSDLPILRRSFRGQALRLEVRPGRYRMRFEVKEAHHGSSILRERELDVAVPARGEVEVEL
jgi:5-hydroxyisourate hydrolase-like protein (transthyretin family)